MRPTPGKHPTHYRFFSPTGDEAQVLFVRKLPAKQKAELKSFRKKMRRRDAGALAGHNKTLWTGWIQQIDPPN